MGTIAEAIKRTKAYYCLDCGKCTSNCPIALRNPNYSPRRVVGSAIRGYGEDLLKNNLIWECLTCRMCNERCPSDVYYSEFIRDVRIEASRIGQEGECSHGGAIQSLMRIMSSPNLRQNRLNWISKDLKISKQSEYLYFVGCLPYFDAFFTELDLNTISIAKSTIRILNYLGIEPIIMENERCCGHDLLWTGDVDNFKQLAQHNKAEIEKTGAKKIIVSCPEGYTTLKVDYPKYVGDLGVEVIHISELLADSLSDDKLRFRKIRKKVTYQDPCRLGRYSGIYEQPRGVMNAIEGLQLYEMAKSGKSAVCCGTSAWTNCNSVSKQIQIDRLKEAKSTGADFLVTACPKCQIHFKCAMKDENTPNDAKIKIMDFTTLVANSLKYSEK
ncbi:MAG TPA: (Fe-S)-binding protein [bacterium (Candidatus Stahlbacteria)]|nr:(Fe-S)-binding protein [Candidatus Stahlbacteria bacterium]